MPALSDLLSWMDNKRRVVGRNISDLVADPSGYLSMTAANIPQTIAEQGAGMAPMGLSIRGVAGPQHEALRLAQERAALPVERYGLGLPADNTPQMRADAMFPQEGYHLSRHGVDVNKLDSGVFAIAPFDAVGTHVGTKEAANARWDSLSGRHPNDVKGVSYPVRFADQSPMTSSGKPFDEQALSEYLRSRHDYDNGDYRSLNAKTREEVFKDHTNIPYVNDVEAAGSISNIVHPDNIRSRFAAFDPWRRNAAIAAMLGVAAPDLLAAQRRPLNDLLDPRTD